MSEVFVGRQPIYNKGLGIYGYELLFRSGVANQASFGQLTADGATSTTIINTFLEIGLEKLVGDRFAFINLTEQFLFEEDMLPISPKHVVLEVLENIPVDQRLVDALKRLKAKGFVVALDDYIYNPRHKPMVALADIIKIDITQLTRKELVQHIKLLKKYNARLLAEKVETLYEFDFCEKLGFDYFQGYFLSKPRIIKAKSLSSNKLAVLNLISVLQDQDSDIEELEEAISFDVSMSYKILKLINSAFFNLPNKVESIKRAIVMLGRRQLSSWASMLALSKLDDRPSEMLHMAMTRGKMCELLAEKAQLKPVDAYFTVGLFSALDILMEREIADVIEPLPLSDEVVDALLEYKGPLGEALRCTKYYEVSDFDNAHFRGLEKNDLFVAFVEAVSWANMVVESL